MWHLYEGVYMSEGVCMRIQIFQCACVWCVYEDTDLSVCMCMVCVYEDTANQIFVCVCMCQRVRVCMCEGVHV